MTCPQQRLNKFLECPKVLLLSLPFTDLQLASRMENQWAHKLKSKTQQQWNRSYLLLVERHWVCRTVRGVSTEGYSSIHI